ncbi:MAG TPA: hypothetical protein PKL31_18235 [Fulvivirga sp.]|nr:hypothetical protein [Fulvivirga sp.]
MSNYLIKGHSQSIALSYPTFIVGFSFVVISSKFDWSLLILITGLVLAVLVQLIIIGRLFYRYYIYENRLIINYPYGLFTKKIKEIFYNDVAKLDFDDSMSSGSFNPSSSFRLILTNTEVLKLHFTRSDQSDMIYLIKKLRQQGTTLDVYSKKDRILNALSQS